MSMKLHTNYLLPQSGKEGKMTTAVNLLVLDVLEDFIEVRSRLLLQLHNLPTVLDRILLKSWTLLRGPVVCWRLLWVYWSGFWRRRSLGGSLAVYLAVSVGLFLASAALSLQIAQLQEVEEELHKTVLQLQMYPLLLYIGWLVSSFFTQTPHLPTHTHWRLCSSSC